MRFSWLSFARTHSEPKEPQLSTVSISVAEATDLATNVLVVAGASRSNASGVVRATISAELEGVTSHGLTWIPTFADHLKLGKTAGLAEPALTQVAPSALCVDAKCGFAHPAIELGLKALTPLARSQGIATMAVRNSYNCLMVSHHVSYLADEGLVGLGFANAPKSIAAWNGKRAVLGTNPVAFACPRKNGRPMVIDQASSKIAKSEIRLAYEEGRPIPLGWALDSEGRPTTDAAAALAGSMIPFGEHKGYAIALMVDILAAGIAGCHFSYQADPFTGNDGGPPRTGQLFIAIDPMKFSGSIFFDRIEELFQHLTSEDGVRLPGDRRAASRQRQQADILSIPEQLYRTLTDRTSQ